MPARAPDFGPAAPHEQTLADQRQVRDSRRRKVRSLTWTVLSALLLGVVTAVLGSLLHLQLGFVSGFPLPWGALLGLVLVGSAQLWMGLSRGQLWEGSLLVIAAFSAALVLHYWPGSDRWTVGLDQFTLSAVPGPAIAGAIWLWGLPVVGVVVMLTTQVLLRGTAGAGPQGPAGPRR